MSDSTLQSILSQAIEVPSYTPPVPWRQVAQKLLDAEQSPELHWPPPLRRAWIRLVCVGADAETSAYLEARKL